ncbi:esterase-like activity of phytase family protein [Falsihalocynthiibacter sp. SS001]|uniref:esterase-like activity of phytase family protein n=1 Tax=Falsihalocynthiibacter sp. SS001 TaxID=3349698 RepID=UPI0036D251D6
MRSSIIIAIAVAALLGFLSQGFATSGADKVRYVGSFKINRTDPAQGGFSGLSMNDDGTIFTAISDKGMFFTGALIRNGDVVSRMSFTHASQIKGGKGQEIGKGRNDSEGLAIDRDGKIFVSFEGPARVWSFGNINENARALPRHENFKNMANNGALEALAINKQGQIFAIPEGRYTSTQPFEIYRFDREWGIFATAPRSDGFLPVGADFGPDEHLYLLERKFSPISGFKNRIRRFELSSNGIQHEELLWQSEYGEHGNLEGLSVWRDAHNQLRFSMISDDNFKFFLRSELVEYALTE